MYDLAGAKMRKLFFTLVIALGTLPAALFASQSLIIVPGLHVWGAEAAIGFSQWDIAPPLDTILWAYLSGAWETNGYFRDPNGALYGGTTDPNAPLNPVTGASLDPTTAPYYTVWNYRWRFGLEQGLINNPNLPQNLLSAFAFFRGEVNFKQDDPNKVQLIYYPDTSGSTPVHAAAMNNLRNSLLFGTKLDTTHTDPVYKTMSGARLEASYEWAPPFLANSIVGYSDYSRLNLNAIYYLPIVERAGNTADPITNLFSLYLAEYFAADYLFGSSIPFEASASLGGIYPIDGLGGAVRGFEGMRFDTNLKFVNNLELRAHFTPIFKHLLVRLIPNALITSKIMTADLVPTVVLFVDSGYYADAGGAPNPWAVNGFIASTGLGVQLDVFDLTTAGIYTDLLLVGTRADGSRWLPIDIELSFHF